MVSSEGSHVVIESLVNNRCMNSGEIYPMKLESYFSVGQAEAILRELPEAIANAKLFEKKERDKEIKELERKLAALKANR